MFGLFYLQCLLDTLLLRFLQSSPTDQDSDLGATGILHKLALLDGPLLTTRFFADLHLPVQGGAEQHLQVCKCLAVSKSASLVFFQLQCSWPNAASFLFDALKFYSIAIFSKNELFERFKNFFNTTKCD